MHGFPSVKAFQGQESGEELKGGLFSSMLGLLQAINERVGSEASHAVFFKKDRLDCILKTIFLI